MIDQIKNKTINTSASDIKKTVDSTSKVKEKVKKGTQKMDLKA